MLSHMALSHEELKSWVQSALQEDVGSGDVTTRSLMPAHLRATAEMVAREPLTLCGIELAEICFRELDPNIQLTRLAQDGDRLDKGKAALRVEGFAAPILTAERVALNYVQRLSGVATLTARYVSAIQGTHARILDTRKTTPGLRKLEKYAVACGGGTNHRMGLYDLVLIKDNHLAALREESNNPVALAVQRAREQAPGLRIEVEADTIEQAEQAAQAGANIILLDNMSLEDLRESVRRIAGRAETEASGGVNLETVRGIAGTGVDWISVGAITHSARSVDVALDFK